MLNIRPTYWALKLLTGHRKGYVEPTLYKTEEGALRALASRKGYKVVPLYTQETIREILDAAK